MATNITDLDGLKQYAAEHGMGVVYDQPAPEPRILAPYHWKWADIEPAVIGTSKYIRLAVDFEDRGGAVRRLTRFVNPRNTKGVRLPLTLNIQCILPGEQGISHRHSAGATRFVIRGSADAYTMVDGEPYPLDDGDFVTTPHLTWHGHINNSSDYVLWLDGLDSPFATIGARFGEEWPDATEHVDYSKVGESDVKWGSHLQMPEYKGIMHPDGPSVKHRGALHPPGFRYSWKSTAAALARMKREEEDENPFDCYHVTYANPITGGPTFPTTANEMTMLTPGFKGRDHRHNSTVVYYAHGGRGVMIVEGERFEWGKGDFIELPSWTTHRHENPSDADAYLYSFTDWPAQEALGQYYYQEW